jgi:hypothetical protein
MTTRLLSGTLAVLVLGAAAFVAAALAKDGAGAEPSGLALAQRASALAQSPALGRDAADTDVTQRLSGAAASRAVGEQLAKSIPLPPNGSLATVEWSAIGATSADGVESFLEYNASCQWYRYWLAARSRADSDAQDVALAVIRQIPDWPSFRGIESGTYASKYATAAASGDTATVQQQVDVNCG